MMNESEQHIHAIQELTEEIIFTYRLYEHTEEAIPDVPLALRLKRVKELRAETLTKLRRRFKLPPRSFQLSRNKVFRLQWIRMQLWFQKHHPGAGRRKALTPCIEQEERLIRQYHRLLDEQMYGPFAEDLLAKQLLKTMVWHAELTHIKDTHTGLYTSSPWLSNN